MMNYRNKQWHVRHNDPNFVPLLVLMWLREFR
jgi:hypothetical protein